MPPPTARRGKPVTLAVAEVVVLPQLQMRNEGLNKEHAEDIAEHLRKRGAKPPPRVHVYRVDGKGDVLVSGFHRHEGYRLAGKKHIPALLYVGTWADAVVAAAAANQEHLALKPSLASKRRAVRMILRVHPQWSDRRIAAETGCSHPFVADVREKSSGNVSTREGSDGRKVTVKEKPLPDPEPVGVECADDWRDEPLAEAKFTVEKRVQDALDEAGVFTVRHLLARLSTGDTMGLRESDWRDLKDEAEEEKPEPPRKGRQKPPANGQPVGFDWKRLDASYGAFVRDIAAAATAHPGEARSAEFATLEKLAEDALSTWRRWRDRLTKRS